MIWGTEDDTSAYQHQHPVGGEVIVVAGEDTIHPSPSLGILREQLLAVGGSSLGLREPPG